VEQPAADLTPFQDLYPFAPHYLEVDGGLLHYVDEGEGKPLLCLHGNPSWSFLYRRVISEFSEDHRVIAPDHIGCGLSDKPQDWSYRIDDHIANAEKLILELDLKDITLLVHDWGGAVGMGVAGRHPERFSRLVVSNTAAFCIPDIPFRIAVCKLPLFGDVAVRGFNAFAGAAAIMAVERPLEKKVKAGFLAPYHDWRSRIATLRFVQDIPLSERHPSWSTMQEVAAGLEKLQKLPMLILWGMRDWCFTPVFLAEWIRRFPEAEVVRYEDANHYMYEDAHERALPRIREFLDRHGAT
jgi:haloalkane dehalogenase